MNELPKDLIVLLGKILVEEEEWEALSNLALCCKRFSACLSPLFPFLLGPPLVETEILEWSNFCLRDVLKSYRGRIEFESPVFCFSEVVSRAVKACYKMMWFSMESVVGFDVLALLNSAGRHTFFFHPLLPLLRGCPVRMGLRRAEAKLLGKGSVERERETLRFFCVVSPSSQAGKWLLDGLLQEMEKEEHGVWSRSLALLFRIARLEGSVEELLNVFDSTCNDESFSRFDGEFCAHSCGELFARPFLDFASVLACQEVTFEATEHEGEFQIRNLPDAFFSEPHFDKHVVPGLGLLFVALLKSEERLIRVENAKYSGDQRWIKSTIQSDRVRRLETKSLDIFIDRELRTITWKKK
jgi:hypothetical protein